MSAPAHELVLYVRDRLLKAAPIVALVADRVWYVAPEKAEYPHIAGFETFGRRNDADCVAGNDLSLDVHVWTRGGIDPLQNARAINGAVVDVLHNAALTVPSGALLSLRNTRDDAFYDQDGLTGHGLVRFLALYRST